MVSISFFVEYYIDLLKLFYAKAILVAEWLEYSLTRRWGNKRIHAFPLGINVT